MTAADPHYHNTRRNRIGVIRAICIGGAALWCPTAPAVTFDAEIAYTADNNVTRAQYDSDILKDQFWSAAAGVSHVQWLNPNHRLIYRGFVRGEDYRKYEGLSNATAGVTVTYQYRETGTFLAPTYGAFFKAATADFKSKIRDSDFQSVGVTLRKPFTDRLTMTSILSGNRRNSDSTAFDNKDVSLLFNVDYALAEHGTLYLTYNYLDGDVVSTANPSAYGSLRIVNAADAINADDAFGGAAANRFAYRLKARTNVLTLGTNFQLSEQQSLDLSLRWIDSRAKDGIYYKRQQLSLAYLVRF